MKMWYYTRRLECEHMNIIKLLNSAAIFQETVSDYRNIVLNQRHCHFIVFFHATGWNDICNAG
jgi:hypothetical protein